MKSIGSDGTYQIVLSPEELLEKLAALVPPPRLNLVRYHGVLAPNAVDRAQIVPGPKPADEETDVGGSEAASTPAQRRHRLAWAVLLARVFQFELSVWDQCGGNVKIVAAVTPDPPAAGAPGPFADTWKGLACRLGCRRWHRLVHIRSYRSTWTTQPRLPETATA